MKFIKKNELNNLKGEKKLRIIVLILCGHKWNLFQLIHLWFPSRQNLDLTETRVFLRIYHLSAFISELCRPRSYYWFLLECNRIVSIWKQFMLQVKTSSFFLLLSERLDINWLYNYFFSTVHQTIHHFYYQYVCYEWMSESFAPIDASDLS